MAQQWDADVELGDIISFALDFKKLQKILKGLLTGMDGMRLDITNLQDQQGKWEETLLGKVNALEKQAHTQVPHEDTAHLKFTIEKMQRDHAEEMTNKKWPILTVKQVSNECKAAVFSTKNDITSRISDLEKHLGQVTETTSNLARDAKEFALKADLHASVQTLSSRLTNTEKSIATEFGSFSGWKERYEGLLRGTDDKVEAMKGDINMLKTITDELSPPEIKKAITNLSREMAKLRTTVREHSDSSLSISDNSASPVPRASNQSLSEIEAMQKDMMEQLSEHARKHFDLRRDVSDLGTLLEALTTGVKGSDAQRADYLKLLEDHGRQLSHLLRTKADISVIETMMVQPGKPTAAGLNDNEKEELSALREIIKSKASKTELAKIRKKLDDGWYSQHTHNDGSMNGSLDASITRVHFRCLACDRLMTPNANQQQEGTPPYFDLAPHVAYRRWRVKDMMKDAKGSTSSVNTLVNSYSPPSTGTGKRSLGPITPRGSSRPKSASISPIPPLTARSSSRPSHSHSNSNSNSHSHPSPSSPQQQPVLEDYDDDNNNDF